MSEEARPGRPVCRLRKKPHLSVDVSSPYCSERLVQSAVRVLRPEQVLFGTDVPYGFHARDGSYDYSHVKGWGERLSLPDSQIEHIPGDTLVRLITESR